MRSPFLPVLAAVVAPWLAAQTPAVGYDPLRVGQAPLPAPLDLDVVDADRDRT
ncbi:MAG: hypothetical protein JNK78_19260, partial [Planctomycetes bacterium]|nr:hypothetical protein [Planctomycetota bacterium]